MNEMFRCITGSMRTVFVLTPAFNDSRWCEWEMQMAQTASVANNISLLPIMLQECPVPDTIKHINYIDVTNGDVPQAAMKLQKNVLNPPQGFIPQNNMLRINGFSFPLEEKMIKNGCFKTQLQFGLPPNGIDALEQKGIMIPKEQIDEILHTLNHHGPSIRISRTTPIRLACYVMLTMIGLGWLIFLNICAYYSLYSVRQPSNNTTCIFNLFPDVTLQCSSPIPIILSISFILLGYFPLGALIAYIVKRKKILKKVIDLILGISLTTLADYKMFIWPAKKGEFLRIVYYDINPCWQHLIQQVDPNIEILDIDNWKLNLTKCDFPLYMKKPMTGSLNMAPAVRHQTIYYYVCFCQYVLAKHSQMFVQ
ncbi:unnamed protein product [Owenia fusiformis]|uniref:TIR domain-containing protein n=1 Tax=Owenia fusiformis TaxID=6347 RepID=A0A8S4Q7H3_OWEFU|nr:unnamed protein product [Owenia fusiformis]